VPKNKNGRRAQASRQPKPLYRQKSPQKSGDDFVHAAPISPAHFELREDGTIALEGVAKNTLLH
jgi:hypothetical protein